MICISADVVHSNIHTNKRYYNKILNCLTQLQSKNIPQIEKYLTKILTKIDINFDFPPLRFQFVELLRQMLSLDPNLRCAPTWCKTHEFVTMNHLQDYVQCKRVRQGIEVIYSTFYTSYTLHFTFHLGSLYILYKLYITFCSV